MAGAGNGDGSPVDGRSVALHADFLALLPVDGASVSIVTASGSHSTVSSSDALASHLEQLQYDLGEGPHWWALKTGRPVLLPDVRSHDHSRWPVFGQAVAGCGARGVFSFPLKIGAVTVGVADLHRSWAGPLSDFHVTRGVAVAGTVADAAVRYAMTEADGDGSHHSALVAGTRREVHQATGMVSEQLDTSATEAFSRLRARAYSQGRTVDDVAREVVARRIDFADLPGSE